MVIRIHQPTAALAGKNIILTGKGVTTVKHGSLLFHRCPYEVAEKQGVRPSQIEASAPDYVDVYAGPVGAPAPELVPGGVYQIEKNPASGAEIVEDLGGGVSLIRLVQVEFLRNPGV